ncbi:MAG: hypothetical protein ABJF23_03010 [Bryobacteraceae bacterium]
MDITAWAKDLLVSRGALVEGQDGDSFRALLPDEVSQALGSSDWLSLRFGAVAGADDPGEWLERLGQLVPSDPRIVNARLRRMPTAPRIDAIAVLDRELAIQNGIYRFVEDYSATSVYYLFSFFYTVESDERSTGVVNVWLNPEARSVVAQPVGLLRLIEAELDPTSDLNIDSKSIDGFYRIAAGAARIGVLGSITALETSANRHMARDAERVRSYYGSMLQQIEKRIAKRAADPEAAERERGRAHATVLDRTAKLEDLFRKHSLRVQVSLTDVLRVALPVRKISVRLIRKKEERLRDFHWNAVLRQLDMPWCDQCGGIARPLFLCEAMHCLCKTCSVGCAKCGRAFCRACQSRCKCGAPA